LSFLDSSSYASFQSSDIGREISVSAFRLAAGSPVEDCDWPSRSGSLLLALSTEDVASLLFAALVPVLAETGLEDVDEEKAFAAFDLNQDVLDPGAAGSCLLCRPNVASLLVRSRDNLDRMPPRELKSQSNREASQRIEVLVYLAELGHRAELRWMRSC
jgi:hypothetical protein